MLIHIFDCFSFFDCSSLCWFIYLVVVPSPAALLFLGHSLWLLSFLWLKFNRLVPPLWLINTIVTSLVVHLSNGPSLWLVSLLLFTFSMLIPLFSMLIWYGCLSLLYYSSLYQIISLVGNSSSIVVFVESYEILIRLLLILWLFFSMVILFSCFFFFLGWFIYLLVHFHCWHVYFSFFGCFFLMVHLFYCPFLFGCSSICCPLLSHRNEQNRSNLMKPTHIYHQQQSKLKSKQHLVLTCDFYCQLFF